MNYVTDIIKDIQLSEKSNQLTEDNNCYIFKVDKKAKKAQIKKAIESLFDTKVASVNTCNYRGKKRQRGRIIGRTSSWKKAFVSLKEGEALDII